MLGCLNCEVLVADRFLERYYLLILVSHQKEKKAFQLCTITEIEAQNVCSHCVDLHVEFLRKFVLSIHLHNRCKCSLVFQDPWAVMWIFVSWLSSDTSSLTWEFGTGCETQGWLILVMCAAVAIKKQPAFSWTTYYQALMLQVSSWTRQMHICCCKQNWAGTIWQSPPAQDL